MIGCCRDMFGDMKKVEVEVADGVADLGDGIGDLFEVFEKEDMTPSLQPCRTSCRKYFSQNYKTNIFSAQTSGPPPPSAVCATSRVWTE